MSRPSRQFKDTQVFGWENEPKDERPSEFMPSTGYSVLSGYHTLPDSAVSARRRRQRLRAGVSTVLVASLAAIALGVAGLIGLLQLLRG